MVLRVSMVSCPSLLLVAILGTTSHPQFLSYSPQLPDILYQCLLLIIRRDHVVGSFLSLPFCGAHYMPKIFLYVCGDWQVNIEIESCMQRARIRPYRIVSHPGCDSVLRAVDMASQGQENRALARPGAPRFHSHVRLQHLTYSRGIFLQSVY